MSSGQSGEGQIRKNIVEAGLVDCIVALPGQLFRSTQIPACLWFLARDRRSPVGAGLVPAQDRRDETLFIDARNLGHMIDRTRRDLSADDIARISNTYHAWRGRGRRGTPTPTSPASARAPRSKKIRKHAHVLTSGRYVGAEPQEDDGEPFEEKMARLTRQWREQQAEARRLDAAIEENLARLGFSTKPREHDRVKSECRTRDQEAA